MSSDDVQISIVNSFEEFASQIVFEHNRRLAELWFAARRDGLAPSLDRLAHVWSEIDNDYLYIWAIDADGRDFTGRAFGRRLNDYMRRDLRGVRFSDHAPGPAGRRMLDNYLLCVREATPFAVLRDSHVFPESGSGYEAVVVPVRELGSANRPDALLGHMLPFAPKSIARMIRHPASRLNVGHRLKLDPG